jgi:hypothetical protein
MAHALRFFAALTLLLTLFPGCANGGGRTDTGAARTDGAVRVDAGPDTGPECLGATCGDACVDLATDAEHCGACDVACGEGERCQASACELDPCEPGLTECSDSCVDLLTDGANCGSCGLACEAGETCFEGACGPTTCTGTTSRCDAACVELTSDEANCGACGSACTAAEECRSGSCVDTCPAPGMRCTSEDGSVTCEDVTSDPANCGACDVECSGLEVCTGACACAAPDLVCGGVCTDVSSSSAHCGSCGNACGAEQICVGGACACPTGFTLCGGSCTNAMIDEDNCGTCGRACMTPAESCSGGACVSSCGGGLVVCGGVCTDTATNAIHCGTCGNACGAGRSCAGGVCGPMNDERTNATAITLGTSEVVVTGTTVGASHDGPTVDCGCSSGANVWYRFTLARRSVVYFDTAGSSRDTSLFLTDAAGTLVPAQAANGFSLPGLCNDDASCTTGGFTTGLEARTAGVLAAGTYYLAVGGCGTGTFILRGQAISDDVGSFFYPSRLLGDGMTTTVLVGTSASSSTCGGTASGEDVRWILTCGGQTHLFSLCTSDGGSFERREGTSTFYDPALYVRSASTGAITTCNDDGGSMGGTACTGTAPLPAVAGDTAAYGSRLNDVTLPRGISAVFVDERTGGSGMNYTLRYIVR